MKIPTRNEAHLLLEEGLRLNPGQWYDHCLVAARAAECIASSHPSLDPETAYVLAALHDIGRREGRHQMRHILDGYNFMLERGYEDCARICLTHSFPYKDADSALAKWDCPKEDYEFVRSYIAGVEYSDYDRLIQLCDYLSLPSGFCLLEKRMVDIALRYGVNSYALLKWKSLFGIKSDFEEVMGLQLYSVLPGIVENTFEMAHE